MKSYQEAQKPSLSWRGYHSGFEQEQTFVARTQAELNLIWAMAFSSEPPAPRPPVLGEGEMALLVTPGQVRRCADVTILETRIENDALCAYWHEETKVANTSETMYEPWTIAFVEKTDLPVLFVKQDPPRPKSPFSNFKPLRPI